MIARHLEGKERSNEWEKVFVASDTSYVSTKMENKATVSSCDAGQGFVELVNAEVGCFRLQLKLYTLIRLSIGRNLISLLSFSHHYSLDTSTRHLRK